MNPSSKAEWMMEPELEYRAHGDTGCGVESQGGNRDVLTVMGAEVEDQ